MAAIAGCAALVLAGVVIVLRWGGTGQAAAPGLPRGTRALLRHAAVALVAGLAAGAIAAGAGGRLVMRLLALTSPEAEGSFTEAGEIVGRISIGGTLGFVAFAALSAGLLSGALYALVRPLLPAGRAGGLVLGVLLLVLAGTRLEPLRADNLDFVLVGPGWLAVLAFTAVGLFHGMLVTAVGARMSPSPGPSAGERQRIVGRVAIGALLLVAAPSFLLALADIV